jgi:heme-degrading monooxygenase HmoA
MAVVKINAIEVPPGAGPELEKRFAHRAHAVDNQPGFLGFQLLRPVKGVRAGDRRPRRRAG